MKYVLRFDRTDINLLCLYFCRHQEEASFSPSYPLPTVPSSTTTKPLHSPATKTHNIIPLHRRSSDSDLSITPKGMICNR